MTFTAATDKDLERARVDRAYRQQLLTAQLNALIAEMNRRNRTRSETAKDDPQLREAALLAVRMADIIAALERRNR